MNIEKWLSKNAKDLTNKTIVITGSTGGLGGNIAKILARLNANLILADRNKEKSDRLKEEILKVNKDSKITQIKLDLTSPESLFEASEQINKIEKIDALIQNAGVFSIPFTPSKEEYNIVFKTNFLYPYFFTKLIMNKLRQSSSKVIVVGSIAYKFTKFNKDDLDYSFCKKDTKIYGNSKRWLMFSFSELMKKEDNIKFAISHPGITPTNITRHFPKFVKAIIKWPMQLVFSSPKTASLSVIKALFDDVEPYWWIGPRHSNIWGIPAKKPIKKVPEEECKEMFDLAENMYEDFIKKYKK